MLIQIVFLYIVDHTKIKCYKLNRIKLNKIELKNFKYPKKKK